MKNYNIEDLTDYLKLYEGISPNKVESQSMDLDQINDNIAYLEDFKGKVEAKIEELVNLRSLRLQNVKMLRKIPKKQDKIAC